MQRIMIIGQPGSGKSTLARQMGAITRLPVFYIDHIHWKSGWIERDRDEKTVLCLEVHAKPQWIFEGGHTITWADRLERADTVIWLDFGLTHRVWRVLWRTAVHYGSTRPDLPEGCPEQFSLEFMQFIWRTRTTSRNAMARLVATAPTGKNVHHLRSAGEVRAYLQSLSQAMQAGALGLPHR